MLKGRSLCAALVLTILGSDCVIGQAAKSTFPAKSAQPQAITDSGRWSVRTNERTNGSYFPNGVEVTRCGPLQSFLEYSTTKDSVTSRRVGVVNGFVIYGVTRVEGTNFGDTRYKMILVERKPGELCEIFFESNAEVVLKGFEPSYFVTVDSQMVLVSRDPVNGNCGCFSEGDWMFDEYGPIFLDVWNVLDEAVKNAVSPGLGPWHGEGFDIQTLTYSYIFTSNSPGQSGGTLHIAFALKDHKLIPVNHKFDDGEGTP
jgi:hypothetical protein